MTVALAEPLNVNTALSPLQIGELDVKVVKVGVELTVTVVVLVKVVLQPVAKAILLNAMVWLDVTPFIVIVAFPAPSKTTVWLPPPLIV